MDTEEAVTVAWELQAKKDGRIAGEAAASWLEIEDDAAACKMLLAIVEGDPRMDEFMPRTPDLSGEYADDPTPRTVWKDITGYELDDAETTDEQELVDRVCEAWLEEASSQMQAMVELRLRQYLAPE